MVRFASFAFFALFIILARTAFAGGLEMAHEWTLYRDGGRIFNSVIVLGAFAWLAIKFGGPMLRDRTRLIAEKFNTLEQTQSKAIASFKEYEKKISKLKVEAENIRKQAREEGEMIRQKIVDGAQRTAEQILLKAAERIDVETVQAKEKLKREATIAAIDLAEEIIRKNMSEKDQKNILSGYIDTLGGSSN